MAVTFLCILSNSLDMFVSLFTLNIYFEVEHIILNMTNHQTERNILVVAINNLIISFW